MDLEHAASGTTSDGLNVVNIEGGTLACVEAGLSVVRGKKAILLERQVRIAAGSLVLLGAALYFVHPAFIGLSAFVGAGLMFSGITDTCTMGMLLALGSDAMEPMQPKRVTRFHSLNVSSQPRRSLEYEFVDRRWRGRWRFRLDATTTRSAKEGKRGIRKTHAL